MRQLAKKSSVGKRKSQIVQTGGNIFLKILLREALVYVIKNLAKKIIKKNEFQKNETC